MWSRASIKDRAKASLTGRYGTSLLVFLIVLGISYAGGFAVGIVSLPFILLLSFNLVSSLPTPLPYSFYNDPYGSYGFSNDLFDSSYWEYFWGFLSILLILYLVILVLSILLMLLVSYPMMVGTSSWFSRNRENRMAAPKPGEVFFAFRARRYRKVVGGMAYMSLIIFLWSLLFIIPGIIASYRYRFVPWILADNPFIGYRRAMELSRQMTDGEKWNIFVFDLSFLGWFLLGMLTCYIGLFFLFPYINASYAELYAELRHRALTNGTCTFSELGFAPPVQQQPYAPQYR